MTLNKKILLCILAAVLGAGVGALLGFLLPVGSRGSAKEGSAFAEAQESDAASLAMTDGSADFAGESGLADTAAADNSSGSGNIGIAEDGSSDAGSAASGSVDVGSADNGSGAEAGPAAEIVGKVPFFYRHIYEGTVGAGATTYYEYEYGVLEPDDYTKQAYPALSESISAYSQDILEQAYERGAGIVQDYDANLGYMSMATISRRMYTARADGRLTSVVMDGYTYNGMAAHGMGIERSAVFDSATGKRLFLADVCDANYMLHLLARTILEETDPTLLAKEWTEDSLAAYIRESVDADGGIMAWFMTGRGLCLYVLPAVITYDMVQTQFVEITYTDYPEAFNDAYLPVTDSWAIPVDAVFTHSMDMDQDGQADQIYCADTTGADGGQNLALYFNDQKEDLPLSANMLRDVYYVHTGNGNDYLYLFGLGSESNGSTSRLLIYSVKGGSIVPEGEMENVYLAVPAQNDEPGDEYLDALLADPENFLLADSVSQALSGSIQKVYHVAADGMPEPNSGE